MRRNDAVQQSDKALDVLTIITLLLVGMTACGTADLDEQACAPGATLACTCEDEPAVFYRAGSKAGAALMESLHSKGMQ